jgi:hypothetical protein
MSNDTRSTRERVRAFWPGGRRPFPAIDVIPPLVNPTNIDIRPRLTTRPASEPFGAYHLGLPPLPSMLSPSSDTPAHVAMGNSATITFSQTGVQPPVYVVTSLSQPPWEALEMSLEKEDTASANKIFTRHFDNVPEGAHQYKIRIGHGNWVVDESKDSGTPSLT